MNHKYKINKLPLSQVEIVLTEIDSKVVEKAEKHALQEFGKELKIDGFRAGHIPEDVIRSRTNPEYVKMRAMEVAVPEAVNTIVKEEKLFVLTRPTMEYKSTDPLEVSVKFDVKPEVKLGDYKKIKVEVKPQKVGEKEVDAAIEHMRKSSTQYADIDRGAKKGDRLEIDFDGFDLDGVPIENTSSKNHPLILGENTLIAGFEDELVGLKKDDEKEFEITFPKDYHAKNMAEKKVKFKVKVKMVQIGVVPELDEKFIEKMLGKPSTGSVPSGKMSVDEFKKEVKDRLEEQAQTTEQQERENKFFDELLKTCTVEPPKSMVDEEKEALLREMKQRVLHQGASFDDYLKQVGKTEPELKETFEKQALDRVSLQMVLLEISKVEKIEVDDLEIEEEINRMVARYPEDKKEEVKKNYQKGGQGIIMVEYQLKMKKTLEVILPKVENKEIKL